MKKQKTITNRKIISAWDAELEAQLIAVGKHLQSGGVDVAPPQHSGTMSHAAVIRQLVALVYADIKSGGSSLLKAKS